MKHGSSYTNLESYLRLSVNACMLYYGIEKSDKRFGDILTKIAEDVKEGKNIVND